MKERLTVYVDGACKGNPGPAGVGVYILEDNQPVKQVSKAIGSATNNIAEYTALITALEECFLLEAKCLDIFTDSELMYKQVTGQYKIKNDKLKILCEKAKRLGAQFENIRLSHVPREKNQQADRLATDAIKNERAPMVASVFRPMGER